METRQLREWTLTPSLTLTGPQRDTLRTVLKATVQPTFGSNDRYDIRRNCQDLWIKIFTRP